MTTGRVPSPPRVVEVTAMETGEACRELSVDDYLVEDVGMFGAQTEQPPSSECSYCCVDFV